MNPILSALILFFVHSPHSALAETKAAKLIPRLAELGLEVKSPFLFAPGKENRTHLGNRELLETSFTFQKRTIELTRIRPMEGPVAERYASEKLSGIRDLFEPKMTGSFPALTRVICDPDGSPAQIERIGARNQVRGTQLWADTQKRYGGCKKQTARFSSVYAFTYCSGSRALFEIRYFAPISEFEKAEADAILAATCTDKAD